MIRIFSEGPPSDQLRRLEQGSAITILHDGSPGELASTWEIRDLNLRRTEPRGALADYRGSAQYESILTILGFSRRLEAVRVDLAHGAGCAAFVTDNPDVLRRRPALESLLGMRFFHPVRDAVAIEDQASGSGP